jgi:hypothetical protein
MNDNRQLSCADPVVAGSRERLTLHEPRPFSRRGSASIFVLVCQTLRKAMLRFPKQLSNTQTVQKDFTLSQAFAFACFTSGVFVGSSLLILESSLPKGISMADKFVLALASALKAAPSGSWSRSTSALALVLLVAGYRFVSDWQSLARLLAATAIFVGIAFLTEWIGRSVFSSRLSPRRDRVVRRRGKNTQSQDSLTPLRRRDF